MGLSFRTASKLLIAAAFCLLALVVSLSSSTLNDQIEKQFEREASEKTFMVSKLLHQALLISDYHEVQRVIEALQGNPRIEGAEVLNEKGDVITSFRKDVSSSARQLPTVISIRDDLEPFRSLGEVRIIYSYDFLKTLFQSHFLKLGIAITVLFLCLLLALIFFSRAVFDHYQSLQRGFTDLERNQPTQLNAKGLFREISELSAAFNKTVSQMAVLREKEKEQSKLAAIGELAAQVAHDIRSPLTALRTVLEQSDQFPEQQRVLIRGALQRIQEIAYSLLQRNRESQAPESVDRVSKLLVSGLVETSVQEVRFSVRTISSVQFSVITGENGYGLFAAVNASRFRRMMSNLLHNSVEAIEHASGRVIVRIDQVGDECRVVVEDNGSGIRPEWLPRLGERGVTFGKKHGSGLGLYFAKSQLESWGGRLHVESTLGKGTSVTLWLPRAEAPAWFVPTLQLSSVTPTVVLDDDPTIHEVWRARFQAASAGWSDKDLVHFSRSEELIRWVEAGEDKTSKLFLIDYELASEKRNGIDVITSLKLEERAVLVTSRFEEQGLIDRCLSLGIRLIPKPLAACIPISSVS